MSDAKFIELVTAAHEYLTQRQEHLRQTFGLASYERWDWDGERGTIVFSSGGIPRVSCDGTTGGIGLQKDRDLVVGVVEPGDRASAPARPG